MKKNLSKSSLEFINHASYFLNYNKIKILVDPWFTGSAFDNGWSLLVENSPEKKKIKETTHIWFSHEHPDHFSVSDLYEIFNINPNIVILFQITKDKRLVNFCKKVGFKVIEIKNFEKIKIDDDFEIQIIKCGNLDSLSIMNFDNKSVINLNDCVPNQDLLKLENIIDKSKKKILLTQFSYAEKTGNPNEPEKRKNATKKKMDQISNQINFFKPEFIIPFASYIFFSNEDNFYMNDMTARIENVEKEIVKNFKYTKPIVLYPGEIWNFYLKKNTNSIEKYIDSQNNIKILFKDKPETIEKITKEILNFKKRIFHKNNKFLIYILKYVSNIIGRDFFPEVIFFIKDLNKSIKFSLIDTNKNVIMDGKISNTDIELNSHSFYYLLKHEWGASTLMINGKFISCSAKGEYKFRKLFSLSLLNSTGKNLINYVYERILMKKSFKIAEYEGGYLINDQVNEKN